MTTTAVIRKLTIKRFGGFDSVQYQSRVFRGGGTAITNHWHLSEISACRRQAAQ